MPHLLRWPSSALNTEAAKLLVLSVSFSGRAELVKGSYRALLRAWGGVVCSSSTCAIPRACLRAGSLLCSSSTLADRAMRAVCRLQARLQRRRRLLRRRPRRQTRACRGARCTSWRPGRGCSPAAPSLCTSSRWAAGCLPASLCLFDSQRPCQPWDVFSQATQRALL